MISESFLFGILPVSSKQNMSVTSAVWGAMWARLELSCHKEKCLWVCPLLLLTLSSCLSGSRFLPPVLRALAWPFSSKQKRLPTFSLSKGHLMINLFLLIFQGFFERGRSFPRRPGSEMVPCRVFIWSLLTSHFCQHREFILGINPTTLVLTFESGARCSPLYFWAATAAVCKFRALFAWKWMLFFPGSVCVNVSWLKGKWEDDWKQHHACSTDSGAPPRKYVVSTRNPNQNVYVWAYSCSPFTWETSVTQWDWETPGTRTIITLRPVYC